MSELALLKTVKDIAQANGRSATTVENWIRRGIITGDQIVYLETVTVGGRKLVTPEAWEKFASITEGHRR